MKKLFGHSFFVVAFFFCFAQVSSALVISPVQMEKQTNRVKNEKISGLFFRPMEPKMSFRGMVKTFTIVSNRPGKSKRSSSEPGSELFANLRFENNLKSRIKTWCQPVSGTLSSAYGYRKHPCRRRVEFHSGVDVRASRGTPVKSVSLGKVVFAGWKRGYGLVVEIEHGGGVKTLYGHCSRVVVKKGMIVRSGELIARVGSTGTSTGNHLHFEIQKNRRTINPSLLMRF
ncbi:MAG: M23 family metallopeptidase [Candidatus Riflebacteria bacterium]|nr:M23 family metallopeptidase [Candidatus Riflebacteria bacterium]